MSHSITVSVIIPIHNTAGIVLRECIDSVLSQNLLDLEIICIDDASQNEDTKSVLMDYENDYLNCVRVVWLNQNVGAAEARNIGFGRARGKYCYFFDSDDIITPNLLLKMYTLCESEKSDVCLCKTRYFKGNYADGDFFKVADFKIRFDDIGGTDMMLTSIVESTSNRLCRTDYLRKSNIRFQSLKSDNDVYFALMTLLCSKRVSILYEDEYLDYRFFTEYQISSNINPINLAAAILKVKEEAVSKSVYDNAIKMIETYELMTGLYELKCCKNVDNSKKYYEYYKNQLKNEKTVFSNPKMNMLAKYWRETEYETNWIMLIGDYYNQLIINQDRLREQLIVCDKIFLWGTGKRGAAFEKWCKKVMIRIKGVCDINNTCVGEMSSYGNSIVSCESVIRIPDALIIASNSKVFDYLNKRSISSDIINLEEYCLL